MNWLRCNKCAIPQNSNNPVQMFCGICTHVLCEKCLNSNKKICPLDNRPFKSTAINDLMPFKMSVYFDDPNKILVLWQKIIRFQSEQRTLLESIEWNRNTTELRKMKEQLTALKDYKIGEDRSIEKDSKCINKIKAYLTNLNQKRTTHSIASISLNTTGSISGISLNESNLVEESVNLDFDDSNNTRSML